MVAWFFAILFLVNGATSYQVEIPARMSVEISKDTALEKQPIPITIEIIRTKKQKVDVASFMLDGKPLKVDFIADATPSASKGLFSDDDQEAPVTSRYRALLPSKNRGLYVLPQLSVKVNGMLIRAPQVTYEVTGSVSSGDLAMDARVVESPPIYPGQKVTLQYRIYFRHPIELTKEEYALFAIEGFRTVGSPGIDNSMSGNVAIETISQEARAQQSGTFRSNPSLIEGNVYTKDSYGNLEYLQPKLQAEVAPIEVTVTPFPEKNRPLSFNGALGSYIVKIDRLSSSSVVVGEKIQVRLTVSGRGDFETVNLPDIKSQKGFLGNFRLPDILPQGIVEQNVKRFDFEIRPLSSDLKAIPSIEFSSFDPVLGKYVKVETDPLPIQVRKGNVPQNSSPNLPQDDSGKKNAALLPKEVVPQIAPIEIEGNIELDARNNEAKEMPLSVVVLLAILLSSFYGVEIFIQKILQARYEKKKNETSRELFLEALKLRREPDQSLPLIRKALLLRLYETKEIKVPVVHPEELSDDALPGTVKRFLLSMERKQFSNLGIDIETKELIDEASQLYYQMNKSV